MSLFISLKQQPYDNQFSLNISEKIFTSFLGNGIESWIYDLVSFSEVLNKYVGESEANIR